MGKCLREYSFFVCSIGVLLGYGWAAYLDRSFSILLIFLTLFLIVYHVRNLLHRRQLMITMCISCLSMGYFFLYDSFHTSTLTTLFTKETTVKLQGRIDSPVKRDGDRVRFFLLVDTYEASAGRTSIDPKERIVLTLLLEKESDLYKIDSLRTGNRLEGDITLKLPDPARNPHAFDYALYLRRQAVFLVGNAKMSDVRIDTTYAGWYSFFESWQKHEAAQVDLLFTNQTTAGYMKSLLLGVQDDVDPVLTEMYSDFGLIHVLAISGLHITLVASFVLWGLERIGIGREKALLLCVGFIVLYVLLVGASPSAVRAGFMGALSFCGMYARKRLPILELWGVTLCLMLLWNPYQLWQIGFQLSFGVTLGLILLVPIFEQIPIPIAKFIRTLFALTAVSQMVSLPFILYWFHQFSPLSGVINFLLVPYLSFIILPLGYIGLLLSYVHVALAYFPTYIIDWSLSVIHRVLEWIHQFVIPYSYWAHPQGWWLVAYFGFVCILPIAWKNGFHRKQDIVIYVLVFTVLIACARQPFTGQNEVRITFLDVGQGDAIVVEVGKEKTYLIDGGRAVQFSEEEWRKKKKPYDVGREVVLPFLRSSGIETIDKMILTHGDIDHVGGLRAIVSRFRIKSALRNGEDPKEQEKEVVDLLQTKNVPIETARAGHGWSDGSQIKWTILSPIDKVTGKGNDASVTLFLSVYGINVLFTGDLEKSGEEALLQTWELPPIDILKVGHHGSKSSTTETFLQKINPKVAIISAGRTNRYGHPASAVLDRLVNIGTTIYRTDQQGAIQMIIRPNEVISKIQLLEK